MKFTQHLPLLLLVFACLWYLLTYRLDVPAVASLTSVGQLSADELRHEKERWLEFQQTRNYTEKAMVNVVTQETWWETDPLSPPGHAWQMYEQMEYGGFVNVNHIHPYQSELILVVEGAVEFYLEETTGMLHPGQYITVPAGLSHGLDNPHSTPVLMRVRYEPALAKMDEFFLTLSLLSQSGNLCFLNNRGVPNPFYTVLLWERFPGLMSFWWLPPVVQRVATIIGAPIAVSLGYSLPQS